jgi:hypothetical protein
MRKRRWISAVVAPVVTAALALTGIALAANAEAATTRNMLVTLYGWPDNSPPGDGTAFGSGHAGGVGTFANPVTFATDQHELKPGTKVYYPFLKRYFIMQDECVECDQDWAHHKWHIDLWVGGKGENANKVINCEDDLTQDSAQVIVNPPSNEPVDTTPLFKHGKCYNPG